MPLSKKELARHVANRLKEIEIQLVTDLSSSANINPQIQKFIYKAIRMIEESRSNFEVIAGNEISSVRGNS
jgi:hypothetical protein